MVQVKIIDSKELLEQAFKVRKLVFVKEQKVDEREEYDEFEDSATRFAALNEGKVIGTCRFRKTDKGVKLERFAVLKDARGTGAGMLLLKAALVQILKTYPNETHTYYLHSQEAAVGFYRKAGFQAVGERFNEANIPHFKMIYNHSLAERLWLKS